MVKTICFVQARQTSSRLRDKVLLPLGEGNKTIVEHINERLSTSTKIDKVVFAIPDTKENDGLETFLNNHGLEYYRGDEKNVLERFIKGIEIYHPTNIIRATADNPLVDFERVDEFVEEFEKRNADYAQYINTPLGVALEIIKADALLKAYQSVTETFEKEHVTPYIYMHPELFNLYDYIYSQENLAHYRLTVDTEEDYRLMQSVYNKLYHNAPIKLSEALEYLDGNKDLLLINSGVTQKSLKEVEA